MKVGIHEPPVVFTFEPPPLKDSLTGASAGFAPSLSSAAQSAAVMAVQAQVKALDAIRASL